MFQNDTLMCLSEIGGLKLKEDGPGGALVGPLAGAAPGTETKYNASFINLFLAVMSQVCKLITPDTDVASVYATGADAVQTFIRHLAIFITSFLKAHIALVENESDATRAALGQTISILLRISRVDDVDIFKICLEVSDERSDRWQGDCSCVTVSSVLRAVVSHPALLLSAILACFCV